VQNTVKPSSDVLSSMKWFAICWCVLSLLHP